MTQCHILQYQNKDYSSETSCKMNVYIPFDSNHSITNVKKSNTQGMDMVKCTSLIRTFIYLHTLQWRHNGRDSVSNHQPCECLLSRLIRRRSKKTSKLRVTGLCAGNSPETGEFPLQRASNAENVSIWWRHHDTSYLTYFISTRVY